MEAHLALLSYHHHLQQFTPLMDIKDLGFPGGSVVSVLY